MPTAALVERVGAKLPIAGTDSDANSDASPSLQPTHVSLPAGVKAATGLETASRGASQRGQSMVLGMPHMSCISSGALCAVRCACSVFYDGQLMLWAYLMFVTTGMHMMYAMCEQRVYEPQPWM